MLTAVRCTWSGFILVWKKLLVISIIAQIYPLAQSLSMSSILGSGWESVTVFSLSCWKSLTQWGRTFRLALGTIKAGDAQGEEDRQILPASKCCWISICHASLYFCGEGYEHDLIVFSASLRCISATTLCGNSSTCRISPKMILCSDFSFCSFSWRVSLVVRISMHSYIAPATLNSLTFWGLSLSWFIQLLQTINSSARTNFLLAFVIFICSWILGLGCAGGLMGGGGFNKSYDLSLSMQVWSPRGI